MQPLSSDFESFLLTYLLNALWQLPLVFAAASLAARASRRAGPAFHHALWTTALFTELLLPAISASPSALLQTALDWLNSLRHTPALTTQVTVIEGPVHLATGFSLPPALLTAAALLYLAALVFFAIRLANGLRRTASLRRRAQPLALTGYARESYLRLAERFAVSNALVAASTEIAGPITLGIRRPTLLLPLALDTTLLPEDLDAALAHEFAHMRRRDFAKNLLYQLLTLPIAFHPIAWLTRARIAETRELLCDDLAANAVAGRPRYARSLLRLARQFSESPHAPTPHAIGIFDAHPFRHFERRVMNLTHHPTELRGAARLLPTALSLILIASACTTALAFRQQVAAPQAQTPSVNPAPTPTPAPTVVLGVPRSAQAPQSFKVDIADASGPNPVVKVLTPPYADSTQASTGHTPHVSANVIAGNRITFVAPIYPEDAKKAKLSGIVVLHAIIGKDGAIKSLDVVSGPEQLRDSALTAVKQWTYKPYLLNGNPVEVDTNITVNYSLNPSPEPAPSPTPSPSASNPQPEATASSLHHIGGDVTQPVVIRQPEPEYSAEAKAAKFSGTVRVYLVVDTDGRTSHVRVVKGVGMGLDEKAIAAVRQYRFKPATLDGRPVPVDLYIDVNFAML